MCRHLFRGFVQLVQQAKNAINFRFHPTGTERSVSCVAAPRVSAPLLSQVDLVKDCVGCISNSVHTSVIFERRSERIGMLGDGVVQVAAQYQMRHSKVMQRRVAGALHRTVSAAIATSGCPQHSY